MQFQFFGSYLEDSNLSFKRVQEQDLQKICLFLNTDFEKATDLICFKIFDSRDEKQKKDPYHSISHANACFNEMTVYWYWEINQNPHFPLS